MWNETMRHFFCAGVLAMVLPGPFTVLGYAQADADTRLDQIAQRIDGLESRIQRTGTGAILFLFGAICALWAQNTDRNAWLWFFLGWFFNVIAIVVLLAKNSDDRRQDRGDPPLNPIWVIGMVIIAFFLLAAIAAWLLQHKW